ncbi:MAG: hypothetical protein IAG10_28035 [Planctomycetaceae bacterium]|nr:hypothetical protein [Planctomycetaceae bacterium]
MTYQIRQLSLGGVLDQAVVLTKDHFGVLFRIIAVTLLLPLIAQSLTQTIAIPQLSSTPTPEEIQAYLEAMAKFGPVMLLTSLATIVATFIGNAAMVHGIASVYLGKPLTTKQAVKRAFGVFWPLIGTSILVGLVLFAGLLLLVIPGIIFFLWYALATQIVVVEGISGVDAMKRSKELMKGNMGSMFVLGFVMLTINVGINLGGAAMVSQPHVRAVLTSFVQCALMIFGTAVSVVFYFSARCKHEQFDLQLLADNVGAEVVLEAADEDE